MFLRKILVCLVFLGIGSAMFGDEFTMTAAKAKVSSIQIQRNTTWGAISSTTGRIAQFVVKLQASSNTKWDNTCVNGTTLALTFKEVSNNSTDYQVNTLYYILEKAMHTGAEMRLSASYTPTSGSSSNFSVGDSTHDCYFFVDDLKDIVIFPSV